MRKEAEKRRRSRKLSEKKEKGERNKKKKKQPTKEKRNLVHTPYKKRKTSQTFKYGKNNQGKAKTTNDVCHLCGAQGVIIKKISGNDKTYPYFSFRMKRSEKIDKKSREAKDGTSPRQRFYWQRE